ncbi:MAG: carbon-nitrogen hydrolase family protein [Gammaproteobacteria bacterium]|nr:MAG: carbon-nitrogen hydrolase family protein [Gammaproteobacteria bacterium]
MRVAALQMASGPSVSANLLEAERLIARAVEAGACLVVLPENFALMGKTEAQKLDIRERDGAGPLQAFLSTQAARHGIWLVGGTIPLEARAPDKVRAACLVFNEKGERVARYDKMHLFDVHIEESREQHRESSTIEAGDDIVVVETPCGRLGLGVCYDLRFPELFRAMLDQRAEMFAIPSAFTSFTGKAHWEILVRARAIENLSFVIAAAQGGYHLSGRETHGDSMIVDPWGTVLARLPRGTGFITADVDVDRLKSIRRNFPTIQHRRLTCTLQKTP